LLLLLLRQWQSPRLRLLLLLSGLLQGALTSGCVASNATSSEWLLPLLRPWRHLQPLLLLLLVVHLFVSLRLLLPLALLLSKCSCCRLQIISRSA
jgi:hypothetical protein